MTAVPARMGVSYGKQIKILLPIGTFLLERFPTETCFHPARFTASIDARLFHVAEIFIACD
jgi:hypothetical protein